jgi:hypothetical protein
MMPLLLKKSQGVTLCQKSFIGRNGEYGNDVTLQDKREDNGKDLNVITVTKASNMT